MLLLFFHSNFSLSLQLLLDPEQPKALQSTSILQQQQCVRAYDKDLKRYMITIDGNIKFQLPHASTGLQYLTMQIICTKTTQLVFTIETTQLQPVRLQLCNDFNKEQQKKAYAIKQGLQLPEQQLIQVQIDLWSLIPSQKGTSEIQISKAKLQYVSVSPEIYQPSIHISGQRLYSGLTIQMPRQQQKIRVPRLVFDSDILIKQLPLNKKLQYTNILDLIEDGKIEIQDDILQFLQEIKTESDEQNKKLAQNAQQRVSDENNKNIKFKDQESQLKQENNIQKSQINQKQIQKSQLAKSVLKPEQHKKIKTYKEFIAWQNISRNEEPDDYEFEDLELEIPFFEITFDPKNIFKQEIGKDGYDRRALTPIKIKGKNFQQRRLIGVRPIIRSEQKIDLNVFIEQFQEEQMILQERMKQEAERIRIEQEEQLRIQQIKDDIQNEDDINFDDVAGIVNIQSQRPAFTFEEFISQNQETEIRDYLLNDLTEQKKNILKQGVLNGKFTIPHNMAPKIGLVYDLVQRKYYDMGAMNDLDDF